jgi:hypothetical protein
LDKNLPQLARESGHLRIREFRAERTLVPGTPEEGLMPGIAMRAARLFALGEATTTTEARISEQ